MGARMDSGMGDRLRAARERLGWTREELAVHAGIVGSVAKVEAGFNPWQDEMRTVDGVGEQPAAVK